MKENLQILFKWLFKFFILLIFILFFSLPFLKKENISLDSILKNNFRGDTFNQNELINNIYPVVIKNKIIEPEEIYILKNDVIKFTNLSDGTINLRNLDSTYVTIEKDEEFFKKFSDMGTYNYEIVNDTQESLFGKIHVK